MRYEYTPYNNKNSHNVICYILQNTNHNDCMKYYNLYVSTQHSS